MLRDSIKPMHSEAFHHPLPRTYRYWRVFRCAGSVLVFSWTPGVREPWRRLSWQALPCWASEWAREGGPEYHRSCTLAPAAHQTSLCNKKRSETQRSSCYAKSLLPDLNYNWTRASLVILGGKTNDAFSGNEKGFHFAWNSPFEIIKSLDVAHPRRDDDTSPMSS